MTAGLHLRPKARQPMQLGGYGLFEPDVAMPRDYFQPRSDGRGDAERRLLIVMTHQALSVLGYFRNVSGFGHGIAREAWDWFFSDEDAPFTFRWVAMHLGLDVQLVRQRAWRIRRGEEHVTKWQGRA